MAYDRELADRLRAALGPLPGLTEKAMFGGMAFLVGGNMAVAASTKGGLLLRCDPAETEKLLQDPVAERFVMRGREMDGWLRVDTSGMDDDEDLARWVDVGVAYASSLPAKR